MTMACTKARVLRLAPVGTPLGRQDGGEFRVGDDVLDDITGRASTPALNSVLIPPAVRGAEWLGHRALGCNHAQCRLTRLHRLEIGVDLSRVVWKPVLQLHLVGGGRARHVDLEPVREMERVINSADRAELDRSSAQPVQDLAG
jgi:hypothetical protein